jgi:adenine-specific DNA-methyltransferase
MTPPTRLELTWPGKEQRPRLEPRILLEEPARSYHAPHRVSDVDRFDNRLIFGDNLLALKALEQEFTGQVKCIFIDPPYNTGSAFTHYDDGLEHSLWLSLMRDRLELLRRLLSDDGSLWITIDDNEAHYLKVLCDETFGRANFVANVVWQKRTSPDMRSDLGAGHDHVLVISKDVEKFRRTINKHQKTAKQIKKYKNPDNDPRGPWVSSDYTAQGFRPNQMYAITTPGGRLIPSPPQGTCWKNIEPVFLQLRADNRIWFGRNGNGIPRRKTYLNESREQTSWTWWPNDEAGHNQEAKKEVNKLFGQEDTFDTPKPERLVHRILELATNAGDLVLDSFAGSGTTGAVAHKMGRRWIMVELGEHCHTHIIPRLRKVIDGADPGGVTATTGWQGGGGFRYFRLAPSLLERDLWGNWVISKEYNAAMVAEAACKLEGFIYAPSESHFWQQGRSSERDFLYATTQALGLAQLQAISEEVGAERSLLLLCAAFPAGAAANPALANLTLKKLPATLLARCEYGHDDYSLQVANLAPAPQSALPVAPSLPAPAADESSTQLTLNLGD